MSGHLSIHPYIKTFDECLRSMKRQQQYLSMHGSLLDESDRYKAEKIVELLDKVISYIPQEYKLTKHDLRKLKEEE
jgi:hypothetical protein